MTDLVASRESLYFLHVGEVALGHPMSPLEAWSRVVADPLPGLAWAFWLRDAVSARFGVARIGGFSGRPVTGIRVGDRLDFFLVEEVGPDHLTLTARDRHLDVMICIETGTRLVITASVVTHNLFGRAYMAVVGPAHRVIVWAMLRRFRRG